jgi:hypothetical protein
MNVNKFIQSEKIKWLINLGPDKVDSLLEKYNENLLKMDDGEILQYLYDQEHLKEQILPQEINKELLQALIHIECHLDNCINIMPDGPIKNILCDANIIAKKAINK